MQRLTRLLAAVVLAVFTFGFAQDHGDSEGGADITAITVEASKFSEFVSSDPNGTCENRLSELEAQDDDDDEVINTLDDDFVCLREALQAAGLTGLFADGANVTLLAPTDEAFADYLEDAGLAVTDFLADTATLDQILRFHILTEAVSLQDALEADQGAAFTTALGPEVEFLTEVAGGGAAQKIDEIEVGTGIAGAHGEADVEGNTIAFSDGYLIPIGDVLVPPAQ